MDMNVEIISSETIKPSSPTLPHLKIYKLSLLDQLAPPIYVPAILFYSASCHENNSKTSRHLKNSFSKTLTQFYPFAGRIKDNCSIECNDHGATYVEAQVDCEVSMVLKQPDMDLLQRLLPCNNNVLSEKQVELSDQSLLAIQVNYFRCGGIAISVGIMHVIADASAAANFVRTWAAIACGHDQNVVDGVIFDSTFLFPPQSTSKITAKKHDSSVEVVMKRFLFDGSKITALREKIGKMGPNLDCNPTRFEAMSALIWGAMAAIARERDESTNYPMFVATTVDLRKRMNPPLPQQCIGNFYQATIASCLMEKTICYKSLAEKIHESIRKMDDEYVRKLHAGGGYLKLKRNADDGSGKNSKIEGLITFSSWCRFPFYEADFGWGKPVWLSTGLKLNKVAIFLDTSDGEGIEAWVGLSKEEMAIFEQDSGILAYASYLSN